MEDVVNLIDSLERDKVKNNLSKEESRKIILMLNNDLSIKNTQIRKMEKDFCNVNFKYSEEIIDKEVVLPEYFKNQEAYLVEYDKLLSEEMNLVKQIAFYMNKC